VLAGSLAFAGAGLVGALGWVAAPAGAATAGDESQLRSAFTNPSETQVDLTADIVLDDCSGVPAGEVRRNSNTALTLDGHGFTVTQMCSTAGVFGQSGGAATTFQNVTITGGNQDNNETCYGGGIRASAPVTVINSQVIDNSAACAGGGISVGSSLTVTNSTIAGNTSGEGGGILDHCREHRRRHRQPQWLHGRSGQLVDLRDGRGSSAGRGRQLRRLRHADFERLQLG
jgi:hypothetical protein